MCSFPEPTHLVHYAHSDPSGRSVAAVEPDGHAVLTAGADNKVIRHDRL